MRYSTTRVRFRSPALAALLTLTLGGCEKLEPNGISGTMQLLRSGSEKVCVAAEVQKALRDQIIPDPGEIRSETATLDVKAAAANGVVVTFDSTALQGVHEGVHKAMCTTTVKIESADGGRSNRFQVAFSVSPSAEDANAVVVTAFVGAPELFASNLIRDAVDAEVERQDAAAEQREVTQARQQLLANINDKWLTGAWIMSEHPTANCGNGRALWFERNHVMEGMLGTGRWSLSGDQLHLVSGGDNPLDQTVTITQADPVSFTMLEGGGATTAFRRCSRAEMETLPTPSEGEGAGS